MAPTAGCNAHAATHTSLRAGSLLQGFRLAPGTDLLAVLVVVVGAVAVDDLPRRLSRLEALLGDGVRLVHEPLVGLVELEEEIGSLGAAPRRHELLVPGIHVVV